MQSDDDKAAVFYSDIQPQIDKVIDACKKHGFDCSVFVALSKTIAQWSFHEENGLLCANSDSPHSLAVKRLD